VQGNSGEVRSKGQQVVDANRLRAFEGVGGRHNPEMVFEPEEFVVQTVDQVGFDGVLEDCVPNVVDFSQCVAQSSHCPSSCQLFRRT